MAELKIYLSDSLNEKFRRIAMRVYGYGRGSLSRAAEEALAKWCSVHEQPNVREKAAGHGEAALVSVSKEAESHVDPDERQNVGQGPWELEGNESPGPIRPSP
jgi:hypothetical protein